MAHVRTLLGLQARPWLYRSQGLGGHFKDMLQKEQQALGSCRAVVKICQITRLNLPFLFPSNFSVSQAQHLWILALVINNISVAFLNSMLSDEFKKQPLCQLWHALQLALLFIYFFCLFVSFTAPSLKTTGVCRHNAPSTVEKSLLWGVFSLPLVLNLFAKCYMRSTDHHKNQGTRSPL